MKISGEMFVFWGLVAVLAYWGYTRVRTSKVQQNSILGSTPEGAISL